MKVIILALTLCTSMASDLFTNGPIRTIEIEIDAGGIESLRKSPREYVPASVGNLRAAVKLKGSSTFQPIDERPSLTVNFEHQRFFGLRKIHLNNSVSDRSLLREQLTGEIYRASGVAAARTTHARVILNAKDLGVYVLKEGFEKEFLQHHFTHSKGTKVYGREESRLPTGQHDTKEHYTWEEIEWRYDVPSLVSMVVVDVLSNNPDSFIAGNNYKTWLQRHSDKVFIFPHGMDNAFFRKQLNVWGLGEYGTPLPAALGKTQEGRTLYEKRIREIFANHFQLEPMTNRVRELAGPIREEIERVDGKDAANEYDGHVDELVQRISNRWYEVERQLNGGGE
jgi:spore coat protein CotH